MTKKTKMTRVHVRMDDLMKEMAKNMNISKTDASHMIAIQFRTPPVIVKKRGRKFMVGGSLVSL